MAGERVRVERNQYPPRLLRPKQEFWIVYCKRGAVSVAHANRVDRLGAPRVVTLDCPPKRPTEVLIQNVGHGHVKITLFPIGSVAPHGGVVRQDPAMAGQRSAV